MNKSNIEAGQTGTTDENSTPADNQHVSQPNANTNVMRSMPSVDISWLNREIANRRMAVSEWGRIALRQNICDNYGRNPIDELRSEIKMIESIRSALEKGNGALRTAAF